MAGEEDEDRNPIWLQLGCGRILRGARCSEYNGVTTICILCVLKAGAKAAVCCSAYACILKAGAKAGSAFSKI